MKKTVFFKVLFTFGCLVSSPCFSSEGKKEVIPPLDWRIQIPAEEFKAENEGEWETSWEKVEFPFDELIYSWNIKIQTDQGFRIFLQVQTIDKEISPWLYGGFWGKVKLIEGRENPQFGWGKIAMDQLLLTKKATQFRFKVSSKGEKLLTVLPTLNIVGTDNSPSEKSLKKSKEGDIEISPEFKIMDLPLRLQRDSIGKYLEGKCQSAAVASAMEYFGKDLSMEEIVEWTHDPEYNYPGIWPRTIGLATQMGFNAYIDRFRNWKDVQVALKENKVILCSIFMAKDGEYIAPPYPSITGHIVALNGITDDGRVVVTDSALSRDNKGYQCQWFIEDFTKIWMDNKGGVGMVICPPKDFSPKLVKDLKEFPEERFGKE